MTVLYPWPASALVPHRPLVTAAISQGWHSVRPLPGPLKAELPPPWTPAPRSLASHFAVDLSALAKVRPVVVRQALGLRAGVAELLLLSRLRARTRRELNAQMLEQATRVIQVTARHWLGETLVSTPADPSAA